MKGLQVYIKTFLKLSIHLRMLGGNLYERYYILNGCFTVRPF